MAVITNVEGLINRRTKIVATVGPASSSPAMLAQLMTAGVNVFRLNMSHGEHAGHAARFEDIRQLSGSLSLPVAILADLCGPKIRTGRFRDGGITLEPGERVTVSTTGDLGGPGLIISQYQALAQDVTAGDRILLADGLFELQVLDSDGERATCEVIHGGYLTDNKGINLPGVSVSAPSLTEKDRHDAAFALSLGVDYIALSFVRTADDMAALRELGSAPAKGTSPQLVAKIEKPEALLNIEAILDASDGIMVARGDLGVELLPEQVPVAQTQLIDMAKAADKPVIVATQMLESMVQNPRPTRAEVTDVANAVMSGTDAVMLSAETAVGDYPVDAVTMMDRIAREGEAHLWARGAWGLSREPGSSVAAVVATAASRLTRDLDARAVIVITQSGRSALTISNARPSAPILAITAEPRVFAAMSLWWGVVPILEQSAGSANPNDLAREVATELGLAAAGQHIVLVRGVHDDRQMNQPTVTVMTL